jgi:hypothetical protein
MNFSLKIGVLKTALKDLCPLLENKQIIGKI